MSGFCLFFFSCYLFLLTRPLPAGCDASVVLPNAQYIINNGAIPTNTDKIDNIGTQFYPNVLTPLIIAIIQITTNLELTYSLSRFYLAIQLLLLAYSTFLLARSIHKKAGYLTIILLGTGTGLSMLMNSFTVANILALIFVNFIIYYFNIFLQNKEKKYFILSIIFLLALFLVHLYLTFPFFLLIAFFFLIIASFNRGTRLMIYGNKKLLKISFIFIILIIASIIFYRFLHLTVLQELLNNFFGDVPELNEINRQKIFFRNYDNFIGKIIFFLGLIGLAIYWLNKNCRLAFNSIFTSLWIIIGLLLPLTYHLGFYFYHERFLILTIPYLAIYADLAIIYFLNLIINKKIKMFFLFFIYFYIGLIAITTNIRTTETAIPINNDQLSALNELKKISQDTDIIYANNNAISDLSLDLIVAKRKIIKVSNTQTTSFNEDSLNYSFFNPEKKKSVMNFKANNIQYFLFIQPANYSIDELVKKYDNSKDFKKIFSNHAASIYQMKL